MLSSGFIIRTLLGKATAFSNYELPCPPLSHTIMDWHTGSFFPLLQFPSALYFPCVDTSNMVSPLQQTTETPCLFHLPPSRMLAFLPIPCPSLLSPGATVVKQVCPHPTTLSWDTSKMRWMALAQLRVPFDVTGRKFCRIFCWHFIMSWMCHKGLWEANEWIWVGPCGALCRQAIFL